MKTFAFVVCVLASSGLVYGAPSIKTIHNECQSDPATHIEDEVFRAIHRGESFDRVKVGAHMLCMSKKFGAQNEDGSVNRNAVRDVLAEDITDKAKLEEITNKCAEEGPTPGETALKLSQCLRENTKKGQHIHDHHGHHHGHHHEHLHEVHRGSTAKKVHNECQADPATHLDDDIYKAIHKGRSFDRTKAGPHILCMSIKMGTQNQDGSVNRNAIRDVLAEVITNETKLEETTDNCSEEGATAEETALKLNQCIRENSKDGRRRNEHHRDHRGHHGGHGRHHDHHRIVNSER